MIDVKGAIKAMRTAYSRYGLLPESCTEHRNHFTIVGRGRDGHTAIHDVPRTTPRVTVARAHDVDHWPNENARLDAMFAAYRNR